VFGETAVGFCTVFMQPSHGLDDPQRSLPTPTILWFCDSL